MKVYLAAPIINTSINDMDMIDKVIKKIRQCDIVDELWVPSEHAVPNAWGMNIQEWSRCVFTMDVVNIDDADWVVMCDFGRHGTAGTSWECGYAFGKNKKILVINMDMDDDHSVMVHGCAANFCLYDDFMSMEPDEICKKLFIERGRLQQDNELKLN